MDERQRACKDIFRVICLSYGAITLELSSPLELLIAEQCFMYKHKSKKRKDKLYYSNRYALLIKKNRGRKWKI